MDAAEFDRLVARVSDPRLISDIYNYCDGRCRRCPFTQRCLISLDSRELDVVNLDKHSLAATMGAWLRGMRGLLSEVVRGGHVDICAPPETDSEVAVDAALERHRQDPLAIRAREYGALAWRVGRSLASPADARDDALFEAAETLEWFSLMIGSKLHRAICGQVEGWEARDEAQTDFNGSAKVALIGIAESRRAWALLMEAGRATANVVPARAVIMLEALDAGIRERFPRAMAFVRPGFDQPRVAEEQAQ